MRASNVGRGIVWSLVLAFPLAALCALIFRFPVPFAGYESGLSAVPRALFAVVFYGVIGGFAVLAGIGAISAVLANKFRVSQPDAARRLTFMFAASGTALAVMALAVLDKIIGPW